jgi:uncharacterized protein (TIGR02271 family)
MSLTKAMAQIPVGSDVYGSDGDKVGTVAEVQPTYIVVEKGFFFPTDYYIPLTAITQVREGQVVLNVSKDTALHSGWETIPEATSATLPTTDVVTGTVADAAWQRDAAGQPAQAGYEATSDDELVIPLREEELTASVRETEAGAARLRKRVVTEDRVLEVPVTEEHLRVERRVVDRAADAAEGGAFEEIVIEVPLTAEEVDLHKQARVAEEVVVRKEAVQHTAQVRGTVRREEVEVVDEGVMANPIDDVESRA